MSDATEQSKPGIDSSTTMLWIGVSISLLLATLPMRFWPRLAALGVLVLITVIVGWKSRFTQSFRPFSRIMLIVVVSAGLIRLYWPVLVEDRIRPHLELALADCPGIQLVDERHQLYRICVKNGPFPSARGVRVDRIKIDPRPPGIPVHKLPLHISGSGREESEARIDRDDYVLVDVVEYFDTNRSAIKLWHTMPEVVTEEIPRQDYQMTIRVTADGDIPAIEEDLIIGCDPDERLVLLRDENAWKGLRREAQSPSCMANQ